MEANQEFKNKLKELLVENLMLQVTPEEIADSQPLFGPGSLGLDSVDALQLVVVLDKNYGLKIPDPDAARSILESVSTIADAISKLPAPTGGSSTETQSG
ncbi:MAG: phosphopantetheine-binding protein [Steroidobacteraceae bacterium]